MFAEMPLDNRTDERIRGRFGHPARLSGPIQNGFRTSDTLFRFDVRFCNIETEICQYG
jgi:hypothetical protein